MKSRILAATIALAACMGVASADSLLPVGDSFFANGNSTNFGTSPTINVGGAGPYRGLIQFDLMTLPPGTTAASIAHANLVLFVNKVGAAGAIDINAATGSWTETTVNGPTAPAIGMTVATGVAVNTASVYVVIDATALVKAWLNGNPPNQGLIISANTGSPATSVFFDSKESATTSHPAILDISFVGGGGAAGPAGPTGPQGPQGAQGPIGATGPSGSLTLPYGGSTTYNGLAFQVQNFQISSGNILTAGALGGTGGSSVGTGNSGGIGRIAMSATDSRPGIGALLFGGAGLSGGGTGVQASGGNGALFNGGKGIETTGGDSPQTAGDGIDAHGGTASSPANGVGGVGVRGNGGAGHIGGTGATFIGGMSDSQPGDGLFVTGGVNTIDNSHARAAFFNGDVYVNGSLSKQAGSFKIDHPLDPANKYLYHSFVESPDMMNIYNGIAELSGDGSAWVQMPDWFQALNQDFRYQLTSMDAPGPNLYIAARMAGNRFRIAGGASGASVSWQVTGIRHDAYAEAHRIPVEQSKTGVEQGSYLNPGLFQQPDEKQIGFELMQALRKQSAGAKVER